MIHTSPKPTALDNHWNKVLAQPEIQKYSLLAFKTVLSVLNSLIETYPYADFLELSSDCLFKTIDDPSLEENPTVATVIKIFGVQTSANEIVAAINSAFAKETLIKRLIPFAERNSKAPQAIELKTDVVFKDDKFIKITRSVGHHEQIEPDLFSYSREISHENTIQIPMSTKSIKRYFVISPLCKESVSASIFSVDTINTANANHGTGAAHNSVSFSLLKAAVNPIREFKVEPGSVIIVEAGYQLIISSKSHDTVGEYFVIEA